jgi:hypothetical protein
MHGQFRGAAGEPDGRRIALKRRRKFLDGHQAYSLMHRPKSVPKSANRIAVQLNWHDAAQKIAAMPGGININLAAQNGEHHVVY